MEFKNIEKKAKKEIISLVMNSNDAYSDEFWQLISSKKGKKRIISLIKNNDLFVSEDNEILFIRKEEDVEGGIDNIYYLLKEYSNSKKYIIDFIKKIFVEKSINFILNINQLDETILKDCNNNSKIMYYDNQIFAPYFNDESGEEEWAPCEEIRNNYLNISEVENQIIEDSISINQVEENTNASVQEQDIYSEENIDVNTSANEEIIEVKTEEINPVVEEEKPKRDWCNDFYELQGNQNNNIKSTADRFNLDKIEKYEMIKEHCKKFDINDLNTLRSNSTVKFDTRTSNSDMSYIKSKNNVEEQLRKLKALNSKNQSMITSDFNEEKSYNSSLKIQDVMSRINDLKRKIG